MAETYVSFASLHYRSACQFRDSAATIAVDGAKASVERYNYVASSVILSVAFLEAVINELIWACSEDAVDFPGDEVDQDGRMAARQILATLDHPKVGRARLLDKFNLALTAVDKTAFEHGRAPMQDAVLLVRLRNELVHARFHVDWEDEQGIEDSRTPLEKALTRKFTWANDIPDAPRYPFRVLGPDCARWAVESARQLVLGFFDRLGAWPFFLEKSLKG